MALSFATHLPSTSYQALPHQEENAENRRYTALQWDSVPDHRQDDTSSGPVNGSESFQAEERGAIEDLMQLYLKDVRGVPRIDEQEEVLLGWQLRMARDEYRKRPSERCPCIIQAGENARARLTLAFLALVLSIARTYQYRGLALLDLVQEGNIGLIHAVDKFDVTRGKRFSTHATWWIKKYIRKAIEEQSRTIRLPEKMHLKAQRLARERSRLTQELGMEPTTKDLGERLGLRSELIHTLLLFSQEPLSLSGESAREEDGETIASAAPLAVLSHQFLAEHVVQALETLPSRARAILALHFGLMDGKTYPRDMIGRWLGISAERVRQIEVEALQELRCLASIASLREFLE